MYIVMLGKPGSGKGTVGKMLSEQLGIIHISSGDLFKEYIKKAGEIGKKAEEYVMQGILVPNHITFGLIEKRLEEPDCENGVILDGFPRTIEQAEELDKFLKKHNKKIDIAIELALTDKEIIERISNRIVCTNNKCREVYNLKFKIPKEEGICDKCGYKLEQRTDDKEETVITRLESYKKESGKLLDYYKEQDLLYKVKLNIHSGKTSEDVAREVKEYLNAQ